MNESVLHLQFLLEQAGLQRLSTEQAVLFERYLELFLLWNAKTNLSAIRDSGGIVGRHFLESIACAQLLPADLTSLLDFGSGGGFPGVPVAICREGVQVTLAESQGKKALFLREVVRQLGLKAIVHADRAETLQASFDCVTMRAVDKMVGVVPVAGALVRLGGWLVLMTTNADAAALQGAAGERFAWQDAQPLPGGMDRILLFGQRV